MLEIIHLVRDSRDVMLSKNARSNRPDTSYISSERWYESILAADRIFIVFPIILER
jgi:hypothetical protein